MTLFKAENVHVGVAQATSAADVKENVTKARAGMLALVPNSIHVFLVVENDMSTKSSLEKFKDVNYLANGSGEIIRHAQHTNKNLEIGEMLRAIRGFNWVKASKYK